MDRPIGMFDSGFGGLTVARALIDTLPNEDVVYIGDTGRYPYGSTPLPTVASYAAEIAQSLVDDFDVKAIIVACNTATAAGLDAIRQTLDVEIIDVIAPGVRTLVNTTLSGRVGVIGTVGTVRSGAYPAAVERTGFDVDLTMAACPGFVEFVERGQTIGEEVTVLAERLLAPVVEADIDTLLLGCTHYPFLTTTIAQVMGPGVTLVSSADETAYVARARLQAAGLLRVESSRVGSRRWLSSGDIDVFRELGASLLGPELAHTERWPLGGRTQGEPL